MELKLVENWPWWVLVADWATLFGTGAASYWMAIPGFQPSILLYLLHAVQVANAGAVVLTLISVVSPRTMQRMAYRIEKRSPPKWEAPLERAVVALTPPTKGLSTPDASSKPAKDDWATAARPVPPRVTEPTPESRSLPAHDAASIRKKVDRCFYGLVGLDDFSFHLSHKLAAFLEGSTSDAILVWGDPGTGKTEIGNRLCGRRSRIPGLGLEGTKLHYLVGLDGQIEFGKIVEAMPDNSIVIMDEMDKVVDPSAQIVAKEQARRLAHSLVNYFDRKKVLWVLLGSFEETRKANVGELTQDILQVALGTELATRVDFRDWRLPPWTLSSLLEAVKAYLPNGSQLEMFKGREPYDSDALLYLAEYCLKHHGGVRLFKKAHDGIVRNMQRNPPPEMVITRRLVETYLHPVRKTS